MKNKTAVYTRPDAKCLERKQRKFMPACKSVDVPEIKNRVNSEGKPGKMFDRSKAVTRGKILLQPINDNSSRVIDIS